MRPHEGAQAAGQRIAPGWRPPAGDRRRGRARAAPRLRARRVRDTSSAPTQGRLEWGPSASLHGPGKIPRSADGPGSVQERAVGNIGGPSGPQPRSVVQDPHVRVVAKPRKARVGLDVTRSEGAILRKRPPSSRRGQSAKREARAFVPQAARGSARRGAARARPPLPSMPSKQLSICVNAGCVPPSSRGPPGRAPLSH